MSGVATLHLMCGLPCSGKTTLAREIEVRRHALRLTPDEWIARLHGARLSDEALDMARDPVEGALWDVAARVLALGVDVILDFGFWTRAERDQFRARAARMGVRSELHLAQAPEAELLRRLAVRNAALPEGTFRIDPARLRDWIGRFEPPDHGELEPREIS